MIIAIDGPAGTGKGTVSKIVAEKLGYIYIDTGAMYRAIALKTLEQNINIDDEKSIENMLNNTSLEFKVVDGKQRMFMNGLDVSEDIRMPRVNEIVSQVSSVKNIRIRLVELQREFSKESNIVMEGRDITTVVFPNAELKIYLTAELGERANRRYKEMTRKGVQTTYKKEYDAIKERDERDMKKEMGALKIAEDAIVIDSTYMTIDKVCEKIIELVEEEK